VTLGPEWRTGNFFPAWRNISYSRIYYPISGEGMVTDGRLRHVLKPGMMLLIPPFANVQVSCRRELCKYWMHFNALLPDTQTDIFFQYGRCIEIDTSTRNDYFSMLFDRLIKIECQDQQSQIDNYEYDAFLRLLIAPFLRVVTAAEEQSAMPRAVELLQYIDRNYGKKLTLTELAAVACMHPNYLCTCFHRKMHMSLFDYINRVRLQHALEYFRQGKMTISEISEKTGFSSIQTFSKNFRKIYGVPPRNYIKMEYERKQDLAASFRVNWKKPSEILPAKQRARGGRKQDQHG
ncbi:MAG: helix-turn-helix domain-containing protein, partial [Lentisphaeria bacterium]|nr:helix-turn-helix domain-containing protein [Lentisphaeria bacterium]